MLAWQDGRPSHLVQQSGSSQHSSPAVAGHLCSSAAGCKEDCSHVKTLKTFRDLWQ